MKAEPHCPSREQLERLLLGAMPAEEMEALQSHVARCRRCLESIRQVTTEDDLVLTVRAGGRAENIAWEDVDPSLFARLRRLHAGAKSTAPASGETWAREPDGIEELSSLLSPPETPDELGRFGTYGILRCLGSGGMGVVFAARQTNPRRVVALKMILAASLGGQLLERFRGETEILGQLPHPNIVPVHEVGENNCRPYFTMEYLDGGSLAQRLAAAPLAAREAAELALPLARAVHFAHQRGVIHRDLKPANVLLAADGTPKIADFGLAKQLNDEQGGPSPYRTEIGALVGTPGYMAPEQTEGGTEVGPAADVYALGAILYECLTGRPPFRAASVLETLEQVRGHEPTPISRLQPKTPRDLQTICLKCLHKLPGRRYNSAAALADDLGRFLRGEPIRARPVSTAERLWKWARRKPALTALLVVAALSLLALVSSTLVYNARLRAAVERAESKEAEARRHRELAAGNYQAARDALNRMLARLEKWQFGEVPQLKELQRNQRQDALAFYQGILARADDPDPEVRLDAALTCERTADIQVSLGHEREAVAIYQRAIELIEALPLLQRDLVQTQQLLCSCHGELGALYWVKLEEAQRHFDKALAIAERLAQAQPDDPEVQENLARINFQRAARYTHDHSWMDAEPLLVRCVDLRSALVRGHPENQTNLESLAEAYTGLAQIYTETARKDKAVAAHAKVEELLRPLIARDPTNVLARLALAQNYINWAWTHLLSSQPLLALDRINQAVELADAVRRREPTLAKAVRTSLNAHKNRAYAYQHLGRWADSVKEWDVVIALATEQKQLLVDRVWWAADVMIPLSNEQQLLAFRSKRAIDLAWAGDHRGATAEARTLADNAEANDDVRYNAACAYAQAMQSARKDTKLSPTEQAATAERYAAEAIALLTRLKAAGYFQLPGRLKMLREDRDVQLLCGRAEFQKLLPKE
ncbi:MAG: protein kinase domain-containing protein [Gemmataceae bacterium]